ncbi:MAG: ATP-binding protein [Bacteroidota bacterium]
MKKNFYTAVILSLLASLLPVLLCGSNLDSLNQKVAILIEENRIPELMETYEELGRYHFDRNKFDDALTWYLKGLELAEIQNQPHKQFHFLHQIGFIYYFPNDDYEQSLTYLLRADEMSKGVASDMDRATNLSRISEVYNNLGAYNLALDYQLEALEIAENIKDTTILALGHRNMGALYWAQKQYTSALNNFKRSLRYYEDLDLAEMSREDSIRARRSAYDLYTCIASIGASYLEIGFLDTALYYIQRSEALADSLNHSYGLAYSEALTGNIALVQKDYDKALDYLKHAVLLFNALELRRECVSFSVQIAEIHLHKARPHNAIAVLNEIEPTALALHAPSLLRDIYRARADAYSQLGQMDMAYQYLKQFVHFKDSLLNEQRISQLAEVEHKYDLQEKNETIADLQKEKQASRRQLYLFGGLMALILLLFLLYTVYQRNQSLSKINNILALKNEEIRLQNERLASSNEDLRQFAHVASHDLREPLRCIGSFATLLQRRYYDKLDKDANEFIDFITKGVEQMDALLADLMAYSVVGIFQKEYHEVNINEVIAEIIESINREKVSQGARISIQNLPTITANRKQMVQLFRHLIDNSIKFRSKDTPIIEVKAQKREKEYLFSIKDNGIGMEEEYKDKIFGLFLRLHNKKSQYKGTGIGLSICKKIVEQHKGKIWIDSHPGEGTTVYLTLPESLLDHPSSRSSSRKSRLASLLS